MAGKGNYNYSAVSGPVVLKVRMGDDVRRIPNLNEDLTFDELVLMLNRIYRSRLAADDELTVKYLDEDGDLVTMIDNADLTQAMRNSRTVRLTLFVNGEQPSNIDASTVEGIRRELKQVVTAVNDLLARLDSVAKVVSGGGGKNLNSTSTTKGRSSASATPIDLSSFSHSSNKGSGLADGRASSLSTSSVASTPATPPASQPSRGGAGGGGSSSSYPHFDGLDPLHGKGQQQPQQQQAQMPAQQQHQQQQQQQPHQQQQQQPPQPPHQPYQQHAQPPSSGSAPYSTYNPMTSVPSASAQVMPGTSAYSGYGGPSQAPGAYGAPQGQMPGQPPQQMPSQPQYHQQAYHPSSTAGYNYGPR